MKRQPYSMVVGCTCPSWFDFDSEPSPGPNGHQVINRPNDPVFLGERDHPQPFRIAWSVQLASLDAIVWMALKESNRSKQTWSLFILDLCHSLGKFFDTNKHGKEKKQNRFKLKFSWMFPSTWSWHGQKCPLRLSKVLFEVPWTATLLLLFLLGWQTTSPYAAATRTIACWQRPQCGDGISLRC